MSLTPAPLTIGERLDRRIVSRLKGLVTAIGVAGFLTGSAVLGGYALLISAGS